MSKDNTFSIDKSFYQPIKGISDEMLGKLFRAIFEYQLTGEDNCDPQIAMPFQFFVSRFKQDEEVKTKLKQKKIQNGAKGGRPKKVQSISEPLPSNGKTAKLVDNESVTAIYQTYPSQCPVKGNNTGKCAKNREQIEKLLITHSESHLIKTIESYVTDCKQSNTYLKNFGTFLNNLPDMSNKETHLVQDDNRKLKWHIRLTGKTRESTQEQLELDKERFGEQNIEFLGYAV